MSDLGEVEITLDGKPQNLRCTLRAARTVSAMAGGFTGAFEGIARYQFATYVAILAAGLDKRGASDLEKLEEALYATGLESVATPLSLFVSRLMNGGRDPRAAGEDAVGNG